MKTATDPRHKLRESRVADMFAHSFSPDFTTPVDEEITAAAPEWPLKKINKIDLAILRVAAQELLHGSTPPKVVIDEAVEIGKKFGAESTPSFINGVLGTILNKRTVIPTAVEESQK